MNATLLGLTLLTAVSSGIAGLAPKKANELTLSIETSTVAQDLEAFYYDSYGEKTLQNLVPKRSAGEPYSDFKFLNFYPHEGDMYFYFYAATDQGKPMDQIWLEYSDGSTYTAEGEAIESWHVKGDTNTSAKIKSTYGLSKCFYKCVIEGFYNYEVGTNHRVRLASIVGDYSELDTLAFVRRSDDVEFLWTDQKADTDFVYRFFKDDYIIIDDASYYQQWIATEYNDSNRNYVTEFEELNWLFFSWSGSAADDLGLTLGELKKVVLDYEYLQYDATRTSDGNMAAIYMGTRYHPEPDQSAMAAYNPRNYSYSNEVVTVNQTTITPSTTTIDKVTDSPEWWQFWLNQHVVNYTYNSIQALDSNSLNALEDEEYKSFMANNRGSFDYAILMKSDTREITSDTKPAFSLTGTHTVTSRCHEIQSGLISSLVFNTEFGDCKLNAIMDPVEISGIFGTDGNVITIENESTLTKVMKTALWGLAVVAIAAISIFAAMLLFKAWRLIKPTKGR